MQPILIIHLLLTAITNIYAQQLNTTFDLPALTASLLSALREEIWAVNQAQLAAFYENHHHAAIAANAVAEASAAWAKNKGKDERPPITHMPDTRNLNAGETGFMRTVWGLLGLGMTFSGVVGALFGVTKWRQFVVRQGRVMEVGEGREMERERGLREKEVGETKIRGYFSENLIKLWEERG